MNFIDILILIISVGGLFYFFIDHIKHSNKNIYYQKINRLHKLYDEIYNIESDNKKTEQLINNIDFNNELDNSVIDILINYRDNVDKLKYLYIEHNKIDSYLKFARQHINIYGDLVK